MSFNPLLRTKFLGGTTVVHQAPHHSHKPAILGDSDELIPREIFSLKFWHFVANKVLLASFWEDGVQAWQTTHALQPPKRTPLGFNQSSKSKYLSNNGKMVSIFNTSQCPFTKSMYTMRSALTRNSNTAKKLTARNSKVNMPLLEQLPNIARGNVGMEKIGTQILEIKNGYRWKNRNHLTPKWPVPPFWCLKSPFFCDRIGGSPIQPPQVPPTSAGPPESRVLCNRRGLYSLKTMGFLCRFCWFLLEENGRPFCFRMAIKYINMIFLKDI